MVKNVRNSIFTAFRAWLILILVLIIIIGICYFKTLPVIKGYSESVAETIMLNTANEAVINVLKDENISYNDIAVLSKNESGMVQSLEIDIYKINNLKSRISNEISKIINNREEFNIFVPIGSFFSTPYTSGIGPKIPFKMQLTSTAFVDFTHEFKAAGINQVLHLIHVKIRIKGSFVTAWYKGGISTETSIIAAQTVIVGAVPDAFTNVIEDIDDNTAGLINDYGALAGE